MKLKILGYALIFFSIFLIIFVLSSFGALSKIGLFGLPSFLGADEKTNQQDSKTEWKLIGTVDVENSGIVSSVSANVTA